MNRAPSMIRTSLSPASVRAAALIVFTIFLVFTGITFYHMATIPTDENLFTTVPSRVMLTAAAPAHQEGPARFRAGKDTVAFLPGEPGLRPGDLLTAVNGMTVRRMKDQVSVLRRITGDTVKVRVFRPASDAYVLFTLRKDSLAAVALREIDPGVVIIQVEPHGASDRAGMKVGDIFTRINRSGFGDSQEADAVLRRGTTSTATLYEGFRGTEPIALPVMLARFGFPLQLLVICLTGVAYMVFGLFLLLRRPDLEVVRALGSSFLGMGYVLAIMMIKREPDPSAFTVLRDVMGVWALFGSAAGATHAHMLLPADRTTGAHRRWILPGLYAAAALAPVALLPGEQVYVWMLFFAYVIAAGIVAAVNNKRMTPQQRRLMWTVKLSVAGITALTLAAAIVFAYLGFGGAAFPAITLLGIPAGYVYVIARYRLIDVDLRIRRNIQYTALSWAWGIVVTIAFLFILLSLPDLPLNVPGIRITTLSVEVTPAPGTAEHRIFLERLAMVLFGAMTWLILWYVRKAGQRLIDRKYYRTQFDYRRAAAVLAEVLSSRLSMNDIARGIVETLVDLMKVRRAGLLVFREDGACCCEAVTGMPGEEWQGFVEHGSARLAAGLREQIVPVRAAGLPQESATVLAAFGFHTVVPIRSHDRLVGVLLVGEKLAETPMSEEDLSFLAGVAKQSAVSIDNAFLYEEHAEKERMRHELAIARRIQLGSLPAVTPAIPGLDIAGLSLPALEVGGDFFDYLDGNGRDVMVVVGDVSGKGTSAALYMAKVQGILRSLHGFDITPREMFVRANRLLCSDLERNSFVTALGAHFTGGERRFTLVRAGHLPLYWYRAATGTVVRELPRGLGLGLNDAGVFARELEARELQCAPGDVMAFVTDGVVEARNAAGEEFGDARITALLGRHAGGAAAVIRDALAEDVRAFGADVEQHDDQTIVIVRAV